MAPDLALLVDDAKADARIRVIERGKHAAQRGRQLGRQHRQRDVDFRCADAMRTRTTVATSGDSCAGMLSRVAWSATFEWRFASAVPGYAASTA